MKLKIGSWLADYSENHITNIKTQEIVKLEPRAIEVLIHFASKPNCVISKEELIRYIWKGRPVSSHAIYRVINLIRKSLDATNRNAYLVTISKKGYKLIQPVSKHVITLPTKDYLSITDMPAMAVM